MKSSRNRIVLPTWAAVIVTIFLTIVLASSSASAEEKARKVRVAVIEVPVGGTDLLLAELRSVAMLDVRDPTWFMNQVKGRGFRPENVMERSADLRWVMSGGSVDFVVHLVLTSDGNAYMAHFIEAETAQPRRTVQVDKSEAGLSVAGASFLRLEMERLVGAAPAGPVVADGSATASTTARVEEDEPKPDDPEVVRQRAADAKQAISDRLQRDWLWARASFRMIGKDTLVAGNETTYSFVSGLFPGFELDIEAYPFALSNAEMVSAGMYVNYYHGFDRLSIATEEQIVELAFNHFGIEGGAIYRMDSPLGRSSALTNEQVRFKLGVRYEASAIAENDAGIPSTSVISVVTGARLLFPVMLDNLAVWANVDVVPFAFFGNGGDQFGKTSRSYGFGTQVGFLYELASGIGMTLGYSFQLNRTNFVGEGLVDGFDNALAFELIQGLRAGFVYQH
ncbi:MAG: hypothetical protein H0U74_10810 [Bradymonadaceae bacterium]|nr:hypothetical protein [Lujinxingiaceae bacterium]